MPSEPGAPSSVVGEEEGWLTRPTVRLYALRQRTFSTLVFSVAKGHCRLGRCVEKVGLEGGTLQNRRRGPSRVCFATPYENTYSHLDATRRDRRGVTKDERRSGNAVPRRQPARFSLPRSATAEDRRGQPS